MRRSEGAHRSIPRDLCPLERPWKLIASLGAVAALLACGPDYRGDGTLRDHGWSAATDRYTLDLGRLCPQRTAGEYRLQGLPAAEFTLGFQFAGLPPEHGRALVEDLGIQGDLTLTRRAGDTVFRHQGPLGEWLWTCAVDGCEDSFVYLKGEVIEEPLPDGGVRLHLVRGQVDGAWGTYFLPEPRARYALRASLSDCGELPAASEVAVFATAGGWK